MYVSIYLHLYIIPFYTHIVHASISEQLLEKAQSIAPVVEDMVCLNMEVMGTKKWIKEVHTKIIIGICNLIFTQKLNIFLLEWGPNGN